MALSYIYTGPRYKYAAFVALATSNGLAGDNITKFGKEQFRRLGLNNIFAKGYGTYTQMKENNGLGIEKICNTVKELIN